MVTKTNSGGAITLPYGDPANTGQYAADLLATLGAPETPANIDVVSAWAQVESATAPGWNALGTTLALPGSTPYPGNSAGVQEYPSLAEGLTAADDMLAGSSSPQQSALAPKFVTDLRSGGASEQTLVNDVEASDWSGGGSTPVDASNIASRLSSNTFSAAGSTLVPGAPVGTDSAFDLNPFGEIKNLWDGSNTPAVAPPGVPSDVGNAIGSDVKTLVFTGIAAIAGLGLVVLGIHSAAGSRGRQGGVQAIPVADLAAAAARVMRTLAGVDKRADGPDPISNLAGIILELTASIRGLHDSLTSQENERRHETKEITNRLGNFANGVLWQGGITLDSMGFYRRDFKGPFASVTIADPFGIGPFSSAPGTLDSTSPAAMPLNGAGFWQTPIGGHETFPMTGEQLTIAGAAGAKLFIVVYVDRQPYSYAALSASDLAVVSSGPVEVTASVTSGVLAAAASDRAGLLVYNADPASNLYLTYGPTSTRALFTVMLVPGAYWEMPAPMYVGVVSGIWDGTPTEYALVTQTTD